MNTNEFWEVIDNSTKNEDNCDIYISNIISLLSTFPPDDIVDFEIILVKTINKADDYGILATMKIIDGLITDDSFLYYRCWLISQGRNIFEKTLENPDFLANVSLKYDTMLEDLLYVSDKAYKIKTGISERDNTFPSQIAFKQGFNYDFGAPATTGTEWEYEDLPNLYPKLCRKYNFTSD